MKYILIVLVSLLLIGFGVLYFYKWDSEKQFEDFRENPEFVKINKEGFIINDKPFFPVVINYIVSIQYDDNELWPCVYPGYQHNNQVRFADKKQGLEELKQQLIFIRNIGYNSIRIVGIGEAHITDKQTQRIAFRAFRHNSGEHNIFIESEEKYKQYLESIHTLLDFAKEAGLRVIFAVRLFHESPATEAHFKKILLEYRNNPQIMAYDVFNEPLYFDSLQRTKKEVYEITRGWKKLQKKYAPGQLITIGLASQRELFEWDPNLVDVDFISFHPYEYERNQVLSEMYWYKQFVNKPWIIGETGIPADNDSIPYDAQTVFAKNTIDQSVRCGGFGYSWWQYKDVDWGGFHQNHLGVVNRQGETPNSNGKSIPGTPKPVNDVFKAFRQNAVSGPCQCPDNYYNFSQNKDYRIIGKLTDDDGNPINGGGILAWDEYWINHYFTTSKPDGTFEIYSNYKFYHWMVSALEKEMIRQDCSFDTANIVNNIPTVNLGEIRLKKIDL